MASRSLPPSLGRSSGSRQAAIIARRASALATALGGLDLESGDAADVLLNADVSANVNINPGPFLPSVPSASLPNSPNKNRDRVRRGSRRKSSITDSVIGAASSGSGVGAGSTGAGPGAPPPVIAYGNGNTTQVAVGSGNGSGIILADGSGGGGGGVVIASGSGGGDGGGVVIAGGTGGGGQWVPPHLIERPLSPWADRHGHDAETRYCFIDENADGVRHSGLAPEFPQLHPVLYSNDPPNASSAGAGGSSGGGGYGLGLNDLDRMFVTEKFQRYYLRGLYSWQQGPLMRYVWFSDKTGLIGGGHRSEDYGPVIQDHHDGDGDVAMGGARGQPPPPPPEVTYKEDIALQVFGNEMITVDENTWFLCLRRDRWLDYQRPENLFNGQYWSIDNPIVWEIVGVVMELVNRILGALIDDRHAMMETLLYGVLAEWDQVETTLQAPETGANVLLSYKFFKNFCDSQGIPCSMDQLQALTPADWRRRFEDLTQKIIWSFVDNYMGQRNIWAATVYSRTDQTIIVIDVAPMRHLIMGNLTLSERCVVLSTMAATVVHELSHAIISGPTGRKYDKHWLSIYPAISYLTKQHFAEPFVDFDAVAELGFATEKRVFGGPTFNATKLVGDLPFATFTLSWPNPYTHSMPGEHRIPWHPDILGGGRLTVTRYPSLQASKLLSAQFWDDPKIPRKSDNFFWAYTAIQATNFVPAVEADVEYKLYERVTSMPKQERGRPGEKELIEAWNQRHDFWDAERGPWYLQAKEVWERTPWSYMFYRQEIINFARSFRLKDEIDCRFQAELLVNSIYWGPDADLYKKDMPWSYNAHPHNWLWHTIGLLMLAALPVRDYKLSDPSKWNHENYYIPRPGKTASWIQPAHVIANDLPYESRTRGESYIWDPLKFLTPPPELLAAAVPVPAPAPALYVPSVNPPPRFYNQVAGLANDPSLALGSTINSVLPLPNSINPTPGPSSNWGPSPRFGPPSAGPNTNTGPSYTFPVPGYAPLSDPYLSMGAGAGFGLGSIDPYRPLPSYIPPSTDSNRLLPSYIPQPNLNPSPGLGPGSSSVGSGFPIFGYPPPLNPYLGAGLGSIGSGPPFPPIGSSRPLPSYIPQPSPGPGPGRPPPPPPIGSGRPQPSYTPLPNPYSTYSSNPSPSNPLPPPPPSFRSQSKYQPQQLPSYKKDQKQKTGPTSTTNWSPTQHPNPLNPYDEIDEFHTFDQLDYITLARSLLLYMGQHGNGHLVSTPWLREILKVADRLQRQRSRIKRDYPYDHKEYWADDWVFQIPVYGTGLSAFVVGDGSGGGGGGAREGGRRGGVGVGWWDEVGKVEDHPDWGVDNSATAKLAAKTKKLGG